MEQVIANLLDANKFTGPGKGIQVTVRGEGAYAVLDVADEGDGIPPEMVESIFKLFVQGAQGADRGRGGLGLGLALVRRLVEMHGCAAKTPRAPRTSSHSPAVGSPRTSAVPTPRDSICTSPSPWTRSGWRSSWSGFRARPTSRNHKLGRGDRAPLPRVPHFIGWMTTLGPRVVSIDELTLIAVGAA